MKLGVRREFDPARFPLVELYLGSAHIVKKKLVWHPRDGKKKERPGPSGVKKKSPEGVPTDWGGVVGRGQFRGSDEQRAGGGGPIFLLHRKGRAAATGVPFPVDPSEENKWQVAAKQKTANKYSHHKCTHTNKEKKKKKK